jgi:hypothetical protein
MIKAGEIRIGNWFHHNVSVLSYRNDDGVINYPDDNFQWSLEDWVAVSSGTLSLEKAVEPINLTEEWINKFEDITKHEINDTTYYAFGFGGGDRNRGVLIIKAYPYGGFWKIELGQGMSKVCQTVHEFQNFIFGMTNTELKLKEDGAL